MSHWKDAGPLHWQFGMFTSILRTLPLKVLCYECLIFICISYMYMSYFRNHYENLLKPQNKWWQTLPNLIDPVSYTSHIKLYMNLSRKMDLCLNQGTRWVKFMFVVFFFACEDFQEVLKMILILIFWYYGVWFEFCILVCKGNRAGIQNTVFSIIVLFWLCSKFCFGDGYHFLQIVIDSILSINHPCQYYSFTSGDFLSPPVHFARWAHMRHLPSVCLSRRTRPKVTRK